MKRYVNGKKSFYRGKGIPNTNNDNTPLIGPANSNIDIYDKTSGCFESRRKFDSQGYAKKDLDMPHTSHNTAHRHDFDGKKRGVARNLTKKEKREIYKAQRKRRFWS